MYILKLFYFPQEVKKEFFHPVKINFFPAFPKGLLIVSIAFLTIASGVSKVLWIVGASINLLLTLFIFREYINKAFDIKHINPAWFIPVVTNIVVPIT
jgi:tellurite resistance protein